LAEYQKIKNNLIEKKQALKDKKASFEQKRNHWFKPAINFVKELKYTGIVAKSEKSYPQG